MKLAALFLLLPMLQHGDHEPLPVEKTLCTERVVAPMLPGPRRAPLIELTIGGKPYQFLLDTGATGGRIDPTIVERLGLKPVGEVRAGDPSGKNTRQVKIYRIPEITIGTAHFYGVSMFADAGPQSKMKLSDGVIGYGVFQELLLTLDYPNKQVILERGSLPASAMAYKTEHGIPTLPITAGKVTVVGHVDSGSDGGLAVPLKYKDRLPLAEPPKVIGHARTLFNSMDIYGAKLSEPVTIGGMPVEVPLIELNDLLPFGNIGGKVLQKFKVVIDQKNKRIQFVKP